MIRNKSYTGYLINGKVETECPQLRIIEPELFERAQEMRQARKREKGSTPLKHSSQALLCGKVFCAHCGNRLTLTSSGRTRPGQTALRSGKSAPGTAVITKSGIPASVMDSPATESPSWTESSKALSG